jgi:predicted XRE-type DNA-binding protein
MIDFQKIITEQVKKKGITWNKIARLAGIDTPRVYAVRDGKPINSDTLEKMLNYLGAEIKFRK